MASSKARRPLPALAFLLALSLLTGLVWWRVIHRSDTASAQSPCSSSSPSTTPSAAITVVPAPASVAVVVLNSTQKAGLAAQVSNILTKDGFKTGTPANDLTDRAPVLGVAEIRYGPTGATAAKLLSYYVAGATLVLDTRTTDHIDLAIGAKYTTLTAPADVTKALASGGIVQLPPPVTSKTPTGKATGKTSVSTSASSSPATSPTPSLSSSGSSTC